VGRDQQFPILTTATSQGSVGRAFWKMQSQDSRHRSFLTFQDNSDMKIIENKEKNQEHRCCYSCTTIGGLALTSTASNKLWLMLAKVCHQA